MGEYGLTIAGCVPPNQGDRLCQLRGSPPAGFVGAAIAPLSLV
jgi:hypothetical protein